MRALILSAPVGAGHDAAARGVASELESRDVEVAIDDGLALLGRRLERFVVEGYRFQLGHAAWSWRVCYRLTRFQLLIRCLGFLLGVVGGGRLAARIAEAQCDVVVSTYPLVSAALASLRRRGRLAACCVTLVTDVDPHPAWIHRALDANLVVGGGDGCVEIRPPVPSAIRLGCSGRDAVRGALGLPCRARIALIVGGAWGVGSLGEAARAALVGGLHPIVVCGQNEALRLSLSADRSLHPATILGFTSSLPKLMAASDVLVQNAGGLTCLEGFAASLPVVMFDPLPGHGEQNARRMAEAGLVARASEPGSLTVLLSSARFWGTLAPRQVARALALFQRPPAAAVIEQATAARRGAIATSRTRRQSRRPVARRIAAPRPHRVLVVVVALLCFGLADAPALARDRIPEPVPACASAPSCF